MYGKSGLLCLQTLWQMNTKTSVTALTLDTNTRRSSWSTCVETSIAGIIGTTRWGLPFGWTFQGHWQPSIVALTSVSTWNVLLWLLHVWSVSPGVNKHSPKPWRTVAVWHFPRYKVSADIPASVPLSLTSRHCLTEPSGFLHFQSFF